MAEKGLRHRSRDQLKFESPAKHSSPIPAVWKSVADDATNLLSGFDFSDSDCYKIQSQPNKRDAGDRGNRNSTPKNISDQEGQTTDDQTTEDQTTKDQTTEVQITDDQTTDDQTPDDQTTYTLFNKFFEFWKWSCKSFDKIPEKTTGLIERVSWTVSVLSIFTMCSQTHLPIKSHESVDPFHYMRVTWASTRGTWMEFGIMPIAASQTTLNMLVHFQIINKNSFSRNGAENLLALLLTVVLSLLFIKTGMFGELESTEEVIISMELFLAGLCIIGLNDLVKKKYTLGTEISLFIVAKICGTIIWKSFSHVTVNTDQGAEYEGAFVFLLQLFSTKNDKTFILRRAFLRENYPNLWNFLVTFFVFFIVIYLKKLSKRKLQLGHTCIINPLFTSVAPLYLQSYCVPIFKLFAQVLSAKLNENFFVNLLGVWDSVGSDGLPHLYPIGGLCYYLTPPRTSLQDPVYAVVYTVFMIASCVSCSMIMNDAAVLSGFCIGALSVVADFLGVFGSGTRVIAAAISIYNYAELINN